MNFFVLNPSFRGLNNIDFLGIDIGELEGLEWGEIGTKVSELVVVLIVRGLQGREPVNVSDEVEPKDNEIGAEGTESVVSLSSVDDSPGIEKVIQVPDRPTGADGVKGSSADSDDSDSVISVTRSGASDRVSHEAMGASFAFGGMSKLDAGNSSMEEFDISESCLSSGIKCIEINSKRGKNNKIVILL